MSILTGAVSDFKLVDSQDYQGIKLIFAGFSLGMESFLSHKTGMK